MIQIIEANQDHISPVCRK